MLFTNTYSRDVQEHGKRFILRNIESISPNKTGVYIFFYNRKFIYIGRSKGNNGVKERLISHYNETHSEGLATWIKALDGEVKFTYITCQETEVDDLEKSLIIYLQPVTNIVRYLNYKPKEINWRKVHG